MWIFGDISNGGSNVFDIFDFDQPGWQELKSHRRRWMDR